MWLTKIVPNCSKSPEHFDLRKRQIRTSTGENLTISFFALEWYSRRSITFLVFSIRYFRHLESTFAGQFKQLSHEPEKFRRLNGIRTHDLCDAGAV